MRLRERTLGWLVRRNDVHKNSLGSTALHQTGLGDLEDILRGLKVFASERAIGLHTDVPGVFSTFVHQRYYDLGYFYFEAWDLNHFICF